MVSFGENFLQKKIAYALENRACRTTGLVDRGRLDKMLPHDLQCFAQHAISVEIFIISCSRMVERKTPKDT